MKPLRTLPILRQWLSRLFSGSRVGAGVALFAALCPPPISAARTSREHSSRSRSRSVQSDVVPVPRETPAPGSDLLLKKEGEHLADALAAFSEGITAEEDAETDHALEAYRKALSLDPSNAELAVKVGFELARRGDTAQGLDLLKNTAKASPLDPAPLLCISQIYEKYLKKPDLAEKYALQALALAPDDFAPHLALFSLYAGSNQPKKAEAVLDKAMKSKSTDAMFWLQLAEVQIRIALKDDGSISPEEVAKIKPVLENARKNIKNNLALAKLADFYVLTKQVDKAIPLYMKIVQDSKDVPGEELLAVRDKLARSLLASGQREEAIGVLEKMIKDAPTRYETYEMLGELYAVDKQWAKAVASYQQALLIDSSQPANFLRVADLQLRLEQAGGAVKTLGEARAKFPGSPKVTYALAIALSRAKEHVKAVAMFEEALQEAKNSTETLLTATFFFQYGAAAEQAGDLKKATEMLRRSIQLDPANSAHAYNYLGYMWVDRGINMEEGGELIRRAVALAPNEGAYLDSLGWYYFKTGKLDEALTNLRKALEKTQPEDPTIDDHLGDVYAAKGDLPQALSYWKRALTLEPSNKIVASKLQKAEHPSLPAPASAAAPKQGK